MSGIDTLRSFAESRSADHEIIRDGITYGDVRDALRAMERPTLQGVLMEVLILYGADTEAGTVDIGDKTATLSLAAIDWIKDGSPGLTAFAKHLAATWRSVRDGDARWSETKE